MENESLFKVCDDCGKNVLKTEKKCPDCIHKLWKQNAYGLVCIVACVYFVVYEFLKEDGLFSTKRNTEISGIATNKTNQIKVPEKQILFSTVVSNYTVRFREAPNELHHLRLRNQRQAELSETLGGYTVDSWVGTISKIATNIEGKATLSISISTGIQLKTWNNVVSDLSSNTLIPQGTEVYETLFNLKNGQRVIFSGTFYPSTDDYIRETSLTVSGSMLRPEFLFRFTSIKPIN